ncbi:MAG: Cache 3/Cache 2 fusion domain-containing protein [Prevotella sp.]|nr:Cache 3/Cache 2 fusion domain-containing protein [Prevotella sp.]
MQKIVKKFISAPSIRLNTMVVLEIVMLLVVSLGVLFFFTRKALVEESKMDAEQRLEGTVQHVDNILMTVEQTTGNVYYRLLEQIDQPERMSFFCRKLVESNANIEGCAIAFKPNYYPGHELFFNYVHRKKYNSPELVFTDSAVNYPYTKHEWYMETMRTCKASWIDPGQNTDSGLEPIITFCLPVRDRSGECVAVMAVGVSMDQLSQIILETKPSPNSYSILLAHDGTYIIHPNHEKLAGKNIFSDPDVAESPSAQIAAKEMLKGNTGNMSFRIDNQTKYLFYKPFSRNIVPGRSMEALKWSIATIYPKDDIFGEYDHLVFHVLGIVFAALLVFYMLCRITIRKQMKPLVYLTESAERIAEGHYDERIPDVKREDEVGVFYNNFQLMQKALEKNITKEEEQRETLRKHHEELQKTHQKIQEDSQVKATFLHNVTNRMIAPAEAISKSVTNLCDNYQNITLPEADKEIINIKQQSETITELLSHKFDAKVPNGSAVGANYQAGKEDNHE